MHTTLRRLRRSDQSENSTYSSPDGVCWRKARSIRRAHWAGRCAAAARSIRMRTISVVLLLTARQVFASAMEEVEDRDSQQLERVVSDLKGAVSLHGGVAALSRLSFRVGCD